MTNEAAIIPTLLPFMAILLTEINQVHSWPTSIFFVAIWLASVVVGVLLVQPRKGKPPQVKP